jgi:HAD superfamily hydrolase (TIGR01509 family)
VTGEGVAVQAVADGSAGPATSPLVIFDCDGVLVDSEAVSLRVEQRVLADLGWKLDLDEIARRFVGGTRENYEGQVEEFLGRPLEADWAARYRAWYREAFERELTAIEGVAAALDQLGLPTCVASNSDHAHVSTVLRLAGLLDRFEGRIFSAQDVARGKPAPDVYLHSARMMGFSPQHCIVVEDSAFGVQAGRAAGMTVLAYDSGLIAAESLTGPRTTLFRSMHELPGLIRSVAA